MSFLCLTQRWTGQHLLLSFFWATDAYLAHSSFRSAAVQHVHLLPSPTHSSHRHASNPHPPSTYRVPKEPSSPTQATGQSS